MRNSRVSSIHGCSAASEKPGRQLWWHQANHSFWRVTHARPLVDTAALRTSWLSACCCVGHTMTPLKHTEQIRKGRFGAGWETRHVHLRTAALPLEGSADPVSTGSWVHLREKLVFLILYLSSRNTKIRTFALRHYQVLWALCKNCTMSINWPSILISCSFGFWGFFPPPRRIENLLVFWNLGISLLWNSLLYVIFRRE